MTCRPERHLLRVTLAAQPTLLPARWARGHPLATHPGPHIVGGVGSSTVDLVEIDKRVLAELVHVASETPIPTRCAVAGATGDPASFPSSDALSSVVVSIDRWWKRQGDSEAARGRLEWHPSSIPVDDARLAGVTAGGEVAGVHRRIAGIVEQLGGEGKPLSGADRKDGGCSHATGERTDHVGPERGEVGAHHVRAEGARRVHAGSGVGRPRPYETSQDTGTTAGIQRAVRGEDTMANTVSSSPQVSAASMPATSHPDRPAAGWVRAVSTVAAHPFHTRAKAKAASSAPVVCARAKPIESRRLVCPRRKKPKVTAGLRWAPLRRPTGEVATTAASGPKQAPMTTRRSPLGRAECRGDRLLSKAATAPNPTNSWNAVPTSSHPQSRGCQPGDLSFGAGRSSALPVRVGLGCPTAPSRRWDATPRKYPLGTRPNGGVAGLDRAARGRAALSFMGGVRT